MESTRERMQNVKGRLDLAEDRTKRLWREFDERRKALAASNADLTTGYKRRADSQTARSSAI